MEAENNNMNASNAQKSDKTHTGGNQGNKENFNNSNKPHYNKRNFNGRPGYQKGYVGKQDRNNTKELDKAVKENQQAGYS